MFCGASWICIISSLVSLSSKGSTVSLLSRFLVATFSVSFYFISLSALLCGEQNWNKLLSRSFFEIKQFSIDVKFETEIACKTVYLRKPGTSQNAPKPVETTQNQPKRPPKIVKRPKISKLGISGIFIAFVFQMPKFGYFGPRSINFLIFQRYFACALFRRGWC